MNLEPKKDLENMIYGVLASYLKQLTGEPWVLFKDKVRKTSRARTTKLGNSSEILASYLWMELLLSLILNGLVEVVLLVIKIILHMTF